MGVRADPPGFSLFSAWVQVFFTGGVQLVYEREMEPLRVHQAFLGTPLTPDHETLYAGFPECRGFSGEGENEPQFEATFLLALAQTLATEQPCLFLLPASQTKWATEQITNIARKMFARWKGEPDMTVRKQAVEKLARAIRQIMVGSRVLQFEQEPPHWVSYGFKAQPTTPIWLQKRLLSV